MGGPVRFMANGIPKPKIDRESDLHFTYMSGPNQYLARKLRWAILLSAALALGANAASVSSAGASPKRTPIETSAGIQPRAATTDPCAETVEEATYQNGPAVTELRKLFTEAYAGEKAIVATTELVSPPLAAFTADNPSIKKPAFFEGYPLFFTVMGKDCLAYSVGLPVEGLGQYSVGVEVGKYYFTDDPFKHLPLQYAVIQRNQALPQKNELVGAKNDDLVGWIEGPATKEYDPDCNFKFCP